jgi:large subunit ribosomal protein L4
MASLTVFDKTGKKVDTYEFDPAELAPRINKQLLHDAVVMYQSNLRLGTAKSKSRAEVAGTTKKMYRQKGTGNARAGSRRSGIRRGGGHIFAKRPRDWTYRLPRKALQLATRMALASKIRDEQVVLIDEFKLAGPKTKDMAGIIKALGCHEGTLLVATAAADANVYLSTRNIDRVSVVPVKELNALSVLTPRRLLMTRAALDSLRKGDSSGAASDGPKAKAKKPTAKKAEKKPAKKTPTKKPARKSGAE